MLPIRTMNINMISPEIVSLFILTIGILSSLNFIVTNIFGVARKNRLNPTKDKIRYFLKIDFILSSIVALIFLLLFILPLITILLSICRVNQPQWSYPVELIILIVISLISGSIFFLSICSWFMKNNLE